MEKQALPVASDDDCDNYGVCSAHDFGDFGTEYLNNPAIYLAIDEEGVYWLLRKHSSATHERS